MVTIMSIRIDTIQYAAPQEGSRLVRAAKAALGMLIRSRQRAAERHLLAALDDRMLKDIGLNRSDVEREIRKRFWQE